jgi:hypothetical protein
VKLNGVHQLLVYADDSNLLGGSIHTIKKSAEAILVGSKETGPEVNGDKTKKMVMSGCQNVGRSHKMKSDKGSFL